MLSWQPLNLQFGGFVYLGKRWKRIGGLGNLFLPFFRLLWPPENLQCFDVVSQVKLNSSQSLTRWCLVVVFRAMILIATFVLCLNRER